jgi:hypothetical protein
MRRARDEFLVPPYSRRFFAHETFPPWRALRPIFDVLVEAMRRSAKQAPLRHVEIPLVHAAKRIAAVAAGDLPPASWYRRARVAIDQLERVKRASAVYVRAAMLTVADEESIARAVDHAIESLIDAVERTPLPDEVRSSLPSLRPSSERAA